jgi:putative membrane protein
MKKYYVLLILFLASLVISGIQPHDQFTWFLEVFPSIIGVGVLVATFKKFRFTDLTYYFILIHCIILCVGGHYTYAEVPLFDWIKEVFHQSRNNYDKVGHFAQGFVPALIVRELLLRKSVVRPSAWLGFLTVCVCATISVFYEFLEWGVALGTGESAEAFLGTQGYVWDTQSDMLYAVIGASVAVLFVSKIQDRKIEEVGS